MSSEIKLVIHAMYILNYLIILTFCAFVTQCYSSDLKDIKPTKVCKAAAPVRSIDDLLKFPTKTCYQLSNYDRKDFGSIPTEFLNENDKVQCWYDLACLGHTASALRLKEICIVKKNLNQALRWCVFAFHIDWMRTGKNDRESAKALMQLTNPQNKDFKTIPAFIAMHKFRNESLNPLLTAYRNKKIECYLKPEERNLKIQFLQRALDERFGTPEQLTAQAQKYEQEGKYEEEAKVLEHLKTPDALLCLATLYSNGTIGRKEDGKQDYETAAKYLRDIDEPAARYNLGIFYDEGYIGRKENGEPDYETAAKYYRGANTSDALHNLGLLYFNGYIGRKENGEPDYEAAAKYYRDAKIPRSLNNLGGLYNDGHVGIKENGEPDYETATKYYRAAKIPESLHNLGLLYASGHIGLKENGEPDYEAAAKYYRAANTHSAHHNLAALYQRERIKLLEGDGSYIEKAWGLYSAAKLPKSFENQLFLIEDHPDELKALLKVDDLTPIIQILCTALEEHSKKWAPDEQEKLKGMVAYYRGNYDQALIHFTNALLGGCPEAEYYIKKTKYKFLLLELQVLSQKMKMKGMVEYYSGDYEQALFYFNEALEMGCTEADGWIKKATNKAKLRELPQKEASESQEKVAAPRPSDSSPTPSTDTSESDSETSSSKDSDPEPSKPQKFFGKKKPTLQEKYLKNIAKINKKLIASGKRVEETPTKAVKGQKPILINLYDTDIEKDFQSSDFRAKIIELLQHGGGQSKVLEGKYRGKKRCISTRLNQEHRLVTKAENFQKIKASGRVLHLYKIDASGEAHKIETPDTLDVPGAFVINVLSCKDHYPEKYFK